MAASSPLDQLSPGDHACLVFDDEPLRARSVTAYIRAGLRQHHRILYHGQSADRLPAVLASHGVDVSAALDSGQLLLAGPGAAYLTAGVFDAEASLAAWMGEADRARAAGYRGMRGIGDMSWARRLDGVDQLSWYEAQVNRVFADGYAMGICLYDRRLFSELELRRLTRTHPATITRNTDPDRVPLLRGVRTRKPPGLRLAGEADLSNRQALRAMMEHLIEDHVPAPVPLTLDLSRLRFADSAAARTLLGPAAAGTHQLRIAGASPSLRRLLRFHWSGPSAALRIE
ncbi:MEDS domain-containing protein [Actinoplanes oblitus]|uniref:MEDS domain-containing protein n=1 Tax=Actinoplanes oblitus TaxID=3040509 RepID=A0ABY8WCS8_9ACTN|nr:MEDS domain-containing protein [Actinoplanes oblitus]WIM95177.1 MEDS domain-containing protein [Actinoplanes oblitus]